jgi:stage II sporulation protein AA (anti-sigma F factor antagonist)
VHFNSRIVDGILVVRLQGELDHHGVEQIRNDIETRLEEIHYQALVLCFADIQFMDSSGLGLILGRYRSVSSRGGKMVLCEVTNPLQKLFDMSGLLKILPVYDTEPAAVSAVRGA